MSQCRPENVTSVPPILAAAGPAEVAALARRLLDAVERRDIVADDAAGRRVVALWRVLAGDAPSEGPDD